MLKERTAGLWAILRHPVPAETRKRLRETWSALPAALRTPRQMYGRTSNGCGATIGVMPRCDFACTGCYLGREANSVPELPVDRVKKQLDELRVHLGDRGNLQVTDGEVLLRPDDEVIEIIRHACAIGLVPMLMTHGDHFRTRPRLLERLMTEAGLEEAGIHIDTTQRGRAGERFRQARSEFELDRLRNELAGVLRAAKRNTGRPLRAALLMTVTRDNLSGVAGTVRWARANTDIFRMLSFQPLARVGRTLAKLGGVTREDVWKEIATGLDVPNIERGQMWMGHPDCTRHVVGFVASYAGATRYLPARNNDDPLDRAILDELLTRFGRVTFRGDRIPERLARILGLLLEQPWLVLRHAVPFVLHWLCRLDPTSRARAAFRLMTGRLRLRQLTILSHHFMNADEVRSTRGRERIASCVFRVPIDGQFVSMCEANALGKREEFYATLSESTQPNPAYAVPHIPARPPHAQAPKTRPVRELNNPVANSQPGIHREKCIDDFFC